MNGYQTMKNKDFYNVLLFKKSHVLSYFTSQWLWGTEIIIPIF